MAPNFLLIAKGNGLKGKSTMKRETFPKKFLSIFTPVEFPEIGAEGVIVPFLSKIGLKRIVLDFDLFYLIYFLVPLELYHLGSVQGSHTYALRP
jgi:hypothetical protein